MFFKNSFLWKAIQRLSNNDKQLIAQLCDKLNEVVHSGKELGNLLEKIKDFQKKEKETERILNKALNGNNLFDWYKIKCINIHVLPKISMLQYIKL